MNEKPALLSGHSWSHQQMWSANQQMWNANQQTWNANQLLQYKVWGEAVPPWENALIRVAARKGLFRGRPWKSPSGRGSLDKNRLENSHW